MRVSVVRPLAKTITAALIAILLMPCASAAQDDFVFLKPDEIRAAYERDRQNWIPLPARVIDAFVAAEDKNFFHGSPSWSTFTKIATFWYGDEKSRGSRALTYAIGQALNHQEIADWIVHRIFLGQGCFGVDGASEAYFGKPVEALALSEIAYLAALPIAPHRLHPVKEHQRALKRRNFVLGTMAAEGFVTRADADAAVAAPLVVRDPLGVCEQVRK